MTAGTIETTASPYLHRLQLAEIRSSFELPEDKISFEEAVYFSFEYNKLLNDGQTQNPLDLSVSLIRAATGRVDGDTEAAAEMQFRLSHPKTKAIYAENTMLCLGERPYMGFLTSEAETKAISRQIFSNPIKRGTTSDLLVNFQEEMAGIGPVQRAISNCLTAYISTLAK